MAFVSIVVPVRNEQKYICAALDSILSNDFPREDLEVLVVDGMSEDGTRIVVEDYAQRYPFVRLVDNPKQSAAAAMNVGIRISRGDIVLRMDAHAIYPINYISVLVDSLEGLGADNVGACVDTIPFDDTKRSVAIATVLSHPFGVGNSAFRTVGGSTQPFEVDTVPFGCYRRSVFDRIGYFDEDLIRNQDNEFNERLLKAGGRIFLIPSLRVKYFARGTFATLWKMLYQYGYFGPLVDIKLGKRTRLRRYIPLLLVSSIVLPSVLSIAFPFIGAVAVASLSLYMLAAAFFSFRVIGDVSRIYVFLSFLCAHFAYGVGHLFGVVDFYFFRKHLRGLVKVELSR